MNVSGALAENGTLVVSNANASTLTAGDSFKLFTAGSYSGAFTNFILPSLAANLVWNTNTLNISGALSVAAYSPPNISSLAVAGTSLTVSGSGGIPYWTYYVLGTTNLAAPQWTTLATNQFDANGNFIFTNGINANAPQTFFRLQLK